MSQAVTACSQRENAINFIMAHGHDRQCPQEGPQLVAAQLPHSAPPAEVLPIFPAKADKSRSALSDPHRGQATATFSSRLRKKTSKVSPHFRHLNSKIGMNLFPPADRNNPFFFHRRRRSALDLKVGTRLEETPKNVKADYRRLQAIAQCETAITGSSSGAAGLAGMPAHFS